jgi:hypothetical protein
MSGLLNHSPAEIVQQLLIDLEYGDDVDFTGTGTSYPVYHGTMPEVEADCICVTDTEGMLHARDMVAGHRQEHHGFQVRIRSESIASGGQKARAIAHDFDSSVYQNTVVIGSDTYSVQSITRTSAVIYIGPEVGTSRRYLFSVNATVSVRQL